MHDPRSATAGIRLGVARGIQYGLIAEPDSFAARAEHLGAGLLRVFFYWSQLEPEPGRYDWSAVDAILDQAGGDTELWFMVGSSSPWATARSTDFLPASPPLDLRVYDRMVRALVEHCGGRVRWWQCENEPCNPLFWTGTATAYLEQLRIFAGSVRRADPYAGVVLGGCPPGLYPGDAGSAGRAFFDRLLAEAGDAFDAFDVHLYGDPYQVPATIADIRRSMRSHGYGRPVLAGECNGPLPLQFPEGFAALENVLRSGATDPWHHLTARQFLAGRLSAPPARDAMKRLYERMAELPPSLQMFMTGCSGELEDLRHRINARDIVIRNMLALSCGVERTVCWQIRPDVPRPPDRYEFLRLMFAKFNLLPYEDRTDARFPCADAFAGLAAHVTGADAVRRVELPRQPDAYLFEITHEARATTRVSWLRHDTIDGDPAPRPLGQGMIAAATPTFMDV